MKVKIEDIKDGDIFVYNGNELVSAESGYSNGCLFVTTREHWNPNGNYNYSNSYWERIPEETEVELIGSMLRFDCLDKFLDSIGHCLEP